MIPGIVIVAIMIYAAICIVFYLHEIGHMGKKIHFQFNFPIPKAWSQATPDDLLHQYGGLGMNAIIFLAVWYFNPEYFFLRVIGLVAWVHFLWYMIWGSFNYEPFIPKFLWGSWVFDDVSNEHWWVAVPLAIYTFFKLKAFYIPVIIELLAMI